VNIVPKPNEGGQGGKSSRNSGFSGKGVSLALPTFSFHVPLEGRDGGAVLVRGNAAVHGQEGAIVATLEKGRGNGQEAGAAMPGQAVSKDLSFEEVGADVVGGKGRVEVAAQGVGLDSGLQDANISEFHSEEEGAGFQEGKVQCEDITEGFSDVGSLNSEEENELEEYIKVIEEENKVEEEGKAGVSLPNGAALAAIPEASPKMSGVRRCKRRASEADMEVALKAERLKAFKNEGNTESRPDVFSFVNVPFISNLGAVGISFGTDGSTAALLLAEISKFVQPEDCSSIAGIDKKCEVLDLEEKELAEEYEVDKLLIQNISSKIMDEVMDFEGDDFVGPSKKITRVQKGNKKKGRLTN
jgi:hypothetical protein